MIRGPLFIVFEGIDGSGKSTQCDCMADYLQSLDLPVKKLFEPTDGIWGKRIREILAGDSMPPAEEQLRLFIKDRDEDAKVNILPALKNREIVIMDRYYFSNAAYQGAAGIPPEKIIEDNRARFPKPDRVYFIDINPKLALKRISKRKGKETEIFEKENFLKKVRDIYLSIADETFLVIDGSKSPEDIFSFIKQDFEQHYMR